MNYLEKANKTTLEYFKVLEPDFPEWLLDYINTPEMLKQQHISITCGTIYSDLFESDYFFSSLDHGIAVALIVWHFTHDKKQTLSGLFHDIATPVFKHCIDFLNGDYVTQESTEELTTKIITDSKEIMALLKRDNIKVCEVDDYHIYPIADNDTPKLSSDRLEYSLSNALMTYRLLELDDIKEIYNDIQVLKDENGVEELGFKTKEIARKFVKATSRLSVIYREDRTRYSMKLIADIVKKLNEENVITKKNLYEMKEQDVINIIKNSKYKNVYNAWEVAKEVKTSKTKPEDVYSVKLDTKVRYINPLVEKNRVADVCALSNQMIKENLSYDMSNYVYLDFNF